MADFLTNRFKQALAGSRQLIGGWSMSGSPVMVEALSHVTYDYLVIDIEHSVVPPQLVGDLLRAADAAGVAPVVRMAGHDPVMIKNVLDLGATTLMFPFVQTADEARAIVEASLYPPKGRRGFAAMTRASRYLSVPDYVTRANEELMLIAQLETPEALARAEEIVSVEGIGGAFIGPGDYSISIGIPGRLAHEKIRGPMGECAALMANLGVPIGTVTPDPEAAEWAVRAGFNFVSIGNDMALMVKNAIADLSETRQRTATPVADIRRS